MFFHKLPIPDQELGTAFQPYDLVIAAEYAGLSDPDNCLPDATKKGLTEAARMIKYKLAREIAWGNSEWPGPGAVVLHAVKLKIVKEYGISPDKVVSVTSNNTIQEVRGIHKQRPDAKRIVVYCDIHHADRYRRIVQYFYPFAEIEMRAFMAQWNEDHPSFWQKSARRWKIMNRIYLFLMTIIPMNLFIWIFEKRTHVISRKKS